MDPVPVGLDLIEAVTRRSAVVWLCPDEHARAYPVWHVWSQGSLYVLGGAGEQPLPGGRMPQRVLVVARDREQGNRAVQWWADGAAVDAGSTDWTRVVPLLAVRRLNAIDPASQEQRWMADCTLLRLTPDGTGKAADDSGYFVQVRGHANRARRITW